MYTYTYLKIGKLSATGLCQTIAVAADLIFG